jgi:hypothetical protein
MATNARGVGLLLCACGVAAAETHRAGRDELHLAALGLGAVGAALALLATNSEQHDQAAADARRAADQLAAADRAQAEAARQRACVVCCTRPKCCAYPCGHVSTCGSCSLRLDKCPVCHRAGRAAPVRQ